jgi:hypothetical protein
MLSSGHMSSDMTCTWIGAEGTNARAGSADSLGNSGWICRCRGPCWRRLLWPSPPCLETEMNVGIAFDRFRAARHRRSAACANTIVARRIPRINKTWNVEVIPEAVVAIETSVYEVSFHIGHFVYCHCVSQVAVKAASRNAASTHSRALEPAALLAARLRFNLLQPCRSLDRVFCKDRLSIDGSLRSGWLIAATALVLKSVDWWVVCSEQCWKLAGGHRTSAVRCVEVAWDADGMGRTCPRCTS